MRLAERWGHRSGLMRATPFSVGLALPALSRLADASSLDPPWIAGVSDDGDLDPIVATVRSDQSVVESFRGSDGQPIVRIADAIPTAYHAIVVRRTHRAQLSIRSPPRRADSVG